MQKLENDSNFDMGKVLDLCKQRLKVYATRLRMFQTLLQKYRNINRKNPCHTQENRTSNWNAAGPDKIQNYWYKNFTSKHVKICKMITEAVLYPEMTFLTEGSTYVLPKTTPSTADPSKQRPITCLPTMYKFLTGIFTNRLQNHTETYNIMADEQTGCRKKPQSCKDQLITDAGITENIKKNRKKLQTAYRLLEGVLQHPLYPSY